MLVVSLFKMVAKHRAEVLSNVPKCTKAVMCLTEEIHVLAKLQFGISYSAVGHEFNVNESTIYYTRYLKQKYTYNKVMH